MATKSYLLAPNFTFEPDGPIRIGRVIADPFRPTKPLFKPDKTPTTVTHIDFDNSFSRGSNFSIQSSIWAQFLQIADANLSGGASRETLTQYTMDSLETIRLKEDPTDAEATELVKEPLVREASKAGLDGKAPVYMITGIKVAKGFRLSSQVGRSIEAGIGAALPVAEGAGVSVGSQVDYAQGSNAENISRSGSDIVFAYQLHVIATKGFWHRKTSVDLYAPSAAFLHSTEKENKGEDGEDFAAALASKQDLVDVAEENEYDSVKVIDINDNGEHCVCFVFSEL